MVVEDEVIIAQDIKAGLELRGYEVIALISSGEEAIQRASEKRPDLILMDISLSGEIDGIEAASCIHSKKYHIPIVYLTCYVDDTLVNRAKLTEPHGYLVKPFEAAELYSTIEMALYRHKMETELRKSTEELKRTNADLEQFAYAASHDLQEPLRMISSYTKLLCVRYKGQLDSDADEFIGYIVESTLRMQSLINDLLTYSMIGKDKVVTEVDCNEVLQKVLMMLGGEIKESGVDIKYTSLPSIQGEASQIIQLFYNLLSNAIKFSKNDVPKIDIKAKKDDENWLFSFKDNGIGLEQEYSGRIFDIFQRLHGRSKYPGTGVGLAICKKVVEHNGGNIWVDSKAGKGATFYFTIPMDK